VLFPANSLFVEGYLTTPGQRRDDALAMIHDLGFTVEEGPTVSAGDGQARANVM
jgi:biotin synthase